ncbi:hypothetical protein Acsp01_02070 [Actinoplanes sp. NBRC 101535]|nr:hypothetical protein Acsp01_02070 [Actinoplanes sp. NBRC 101535]
MVTSGAQPARIHHTPAGVVIWGVQRARIHHAPTGVVIWGVQRARIHHTPTGVVIWGVQRARIHHTPTGVVIWGVQRARIHHTPTGVVTSGVQRARNHHVDGLRMLTTKRVLTARSLSPCSRVRSSQPSVVAVPWADLYCGRRLGGCGPSSVVEARFVESCGRRLGGFSREPRSVADDRRLFEGVTVRWGRWFGRRFDGVTERSEAGGRGATGRERERPGSSGLTGRSGGCWGEGRVR